MNNKVFVEGLSRDEVTVHLIAPQPDYKVRSDFMRTMCGKQISFKYNTAIMKEEYGFRIGNKCPKCFDGAGDESS